MKALHRKHLMALAVLPSLAAWPPLGLRLTGRA